MRALKLVVAVATVAAGIISAACQTAGSDRKPRPGAVRSAETTWLIFIDDLHVQFRNTGYLRALLRTISRELIRETDVFAVASSGPSDVVIGPTTDRGLLDAAIKKTTGAGLIPIETVQAVSRRPVRNEVDYRAGVALSAAREFIAKAEQVRSRRKSLIFISSGHGFEPPPYSARSVAPRSGGKRPATVEELLPEFAALTRQARRAGVKVFAIEPRTPVATDPNVERPEWLDYFAATRRNLRALCDQTGGLALLETQDAELVKRIRDRNALKDPEP